MLTEVLIQEFPTIPLTFTVKKKTFIGPNDHLSTLFVTLIVKLACLLQMTLNNMVSSY